MTENKTKKPTKREMLMAIREVVSDNEEYVTFINHELELLEKKNSKSTPSKNQVENEGIKAIILETLATVGKAVTVTELINASEELSKYTNQKISALLKQLKDSEQIVKVTDKKKTYFSLSE